LTDRLQRLDLEEAVQRPRDVLLHPLYGHYCRDEHRPVAFGAHGVAWGWLVRVLALARVCAVREAQLVSEPHASQATAAGRGTAGDTGA
jgi:hypothetical protein